MVTNKANPIDTSFLDDLDLDQDVSRRLSLHLTSTYYGNDEIYVCPILKSHKAEDILSEWDRIFSENKSHMNETLINLETSNRSGFGPRSIAVPWSDRRQLVLNYFKDSDSHFKLPAVRKDKSQKYLRALTLDNTVKFLKNDTNSGLPYYTRKGIVKNRLRSRFNKILLRKDPCILFTRTQEKMKTRSVWGFPIADTLNEMRYYFPLLNFQKKLGWRAALHGPSHINKAMTALVQRAVENKLSIVSIDFSAYDATVGKGLQDHAFDYIESLFQPECKAELRYIRDRFNTIGLVTPDGVLEGSHGVPSGSTFTNEVDSIVQFIIAISTNCVTQELMQIQGDDGVYALDSSNVKYLYNAFKGCGLNINEDKSHIGNNYAIYLQNLFHIDYYDKKSGLIGGIYPIYRALNRILYQERWYDFEEYGIDGKDYYAIRTISILENCKYHPLFKKFVRFIMKLDKYSLNVTENGVRKYIEMHSQTQGASGVIHNQYSDDVRGIRNFETYKLIKKHMF